jgi:hypothetical protein
MYACTLVRLWEEDAVARRMTIVFDDEDLYTKLKVEAARTHRPAKDIVADALELLFASEHDLSGRWSIRAVARDDEPAARVLHELGITR